MPINNIEENNSARDRLIVQLRTGRLMGCTGAGLSIWAGYRSWQGVIERLAEEVERRRNGEIVTRQVMQNYGHDNLLCAKRLGSDLGEPGFTEFVRAEFGPTGARVDDVLLRLAALPLRHMLTLNFDISYENALSSLGVRFQTITSSDRRALARFLRDMDDPNCLKHVVHLHGKFDDPVDQIALTDAGYGHLYDDFFRKFVWSMATKRLFFLGFGFKDQHFVERLRDCAWEVQGNGLNHFALVGLRPEENDAPVRNVLNGYLIDPIFYNVHVDDHEQEQHNEFADIVNGISATLEMPEEAVPPQPPIVPPRPVGRDPEDERRVEELNRRILDRIAPGGDGV